jgi:hypothetical protein
VRDKLATRYWRIAGRREEFLVILSRGGMLGIARHEIRR